LIQISRRITARDQLRIGKGGVFLVVATDPPAHDSQSQIEQFIQELRHKPLDTNIPENVFEQTSMVMADTEYLSTFKPIRDLTFASIVGQMQTDENRLRMRPNKEDKTKRWDYLLSKERSWEKTPHIPFAITNHHEARWPEPAIVVDLNAPDAVLIEAFGLWLAKQRSQYYDNSMLKIPKKPFYDRWASYGLLPYIDLCIWAEEEEKVILDKVMVSAIMPNLEDGMDKFRKTVKPLIKSLDQLAQKLQPLAALEVEFFEG
jgi:hypothetical protein